MARPHSWLPRLHEISARVANSVRSHYDGHDLERLFELQPRAAQKLLELLATVKVGNARLVDREVLSTFLDRVREADDTAGLFEQIRAERSVLSRKKLRTLVRRDYAQVELDSLPASMSLSRGRVEVSFLTLDQLAEDLFKLAQLLTDHTDEFARAFEPQPPSPTDTDSGELRTLFAELERMEEARRTGAQYGS